MNSKLGLIAGLVLVASVAAWQSQAAKAAGASAQDAAATTAPAPAKIPEEAVKMVNPVKPSAAGLAHAKKLFGFDCAMCHGKDGDGQGDLAQEMKLKLPDWRDPASLKDMTDGEIYYIISHGRGQMPAGADQMKPEEIWTMVLYVRSFAEKTAPAREKQ
jgi:mono/diheme cytochrome c family protein